MGDNLKQAVLNGTVTGERIDLSVQRILVPMFKVGIFDVPNNNSYYNNVTNH